MAERYAQVTVRSREEWHDWLVDHHDSHPGAWVTTFKKASGKPHVAYEQLVEEALAFGWVDSRPRKLDAKRFQLLITPRNPSSNWSRANKKRVERLIASRRMTPAGMVLVETAKANGAWDALDAIERLSEPDDLRDALDGTPHAQLLGRVSTIHQARDPRMDRQRQAARYSGESRE